VHVEALDADADLAGADEGAAQCALDGVVEVDVVEDDEGVLPPEFEGVADEPFRGALGGCSP
jgi:hypothetical protein